jgi:hypothetical protein
MQMKKLVESDRPVDGRESCSDLGLGWEPRGPPRLQSRSVRSTGLNPRQLIGIGPVNPSV